MRMPSAWQIAVIVIALILLFGWKSLPNMARSLGQSMRIFKSEVDEMKGGKESPSAASKDTVQGETSGQASGETSGEGSGQSGASGDQSQHSAGGDTAPHGAGEDPGRDEPRA